jgi:hypothetical protein
VPTPAILPQTGVLANAPILWPLVIVSMVVLGILFLVVSLHLRRAD